jgi:hypothetical protein
VTSRVSRTFLLAAAVFVSGCVAGCHSDHIDTTIENRTGAAVQLLEVDYPSASFGDDRLDAGAIYRYRFQVRGSGQLTLQYTDPSGREIHIKGPTLVEREHGQLQIVLQPEGKAEFFPHFLPGP